MIITNLSGFCGEICLYMAVVGFIAGSFGSMKSDLLYLAIILATGTLCMLCKRLKGVLKYIPLVLPSILLVLADSVAALILPLPMWFYMALRTAKGQWEETYDHVRRILKLGLIVYPILAFISAASSGFARLCAQSLPFFVVWLLISILDLRLLRTDSTAFGVKYKLLNAAMILLIAVIGFLLSSDVVRGAFLAVISVIYKYVISPILIGVVLLIAIIPTLLVSLLKYLLALFKNGETQPAEMNIGQSAKEIFGVIDVAEPSEWFGNLLLALAIVFAVAIVCYIMYRLLGRHSSPEPFHRSLTRECISPVIPGGKKKQIFASDTPADVVRNCYRRYLMLCRSRGINVDGSIASDEICGLSAFFAGTEKPLRLRGLWLPARYSGADVSGEDAKQARDALKSIRIRMLKH